MAKALPIDELGLAILKGGLGWHEGNYLTTLGQDQRYAHDAAARMAVAEALGWLRGRGLIARSPDQMNPESIATTRAGEAALKRGLGFVRASHRLQEGLHPEIEARARRQFLLGEYEQAVFVAMKAVEVRVRALGGFGDEVVGRKLMNAAFGPGNPLADPSATAGEQEAMKLLFSGAYGVLRNPSGHREVDYSDVAEAAEAVVTASLLMRILDRIARFMASGC